MNNFKVPEQDQKILDTPAKDLHTDEELFRKYELAFHNVFDDTRGPQMIESKKEWGRRNPKKKFHGEYGKRVMEFHAKKIAE